MITYQDFFLFCTFVVALISLIYQIFKDRKKQPPLLALVTAIRLKRYSCYCSRVAVSMAFPFYIYRLSYGHSFCKTFYTS